jgi:hypothetical protein
MPATMSGHRPSGETPEDTTPHPNAHIGGNQVIGFSSSTTAAGAGRPTASTVSAERVMRERYL